MALQIDVLYDSSVDLAPTGFKAAVAAVVQYFQAQFFDPITITVQVGYGEVDGSPLSAGALGENTSYLDPYSYSEIHNALLSDAKSADDKAAAATLPANDPTGGGQFWVPTAEAKALGLAQNSNNVDGFIGVSNTASFAYDDSAGVPPGQYDFSATFAHELTEIMGRGLLAGQTVGGISNSYYPLDLFHYAASGVRTFKGNQPGYFSIDNGTTNLDRFNTNPNGDYGDWAASAGNDAFSAFSNSGVVNSITPTDLRELDVLGYDRSAAAGMTADKFHAVESLTGDTYYGVVYDGSGVYSLGSTLSAGPDQLGGHWTYFIDSISAADAAHQNSFYAGKVYDYYYWDTDQESFAYPHYGTAGFMGGPGVDKTSFSGASYLGSEGDVVAFKGNYYSFGYAGSTVVPEISVMKVYQFHAVELTTGDSYYGVLYDNAGHYSAGSTLTAGPDQLGGHWTYTVDSATVADSAHQNSFYAGKVYDYYYWDAGAGAFFYPFYGTAGFTQGAEKDKTSYSGSQYLGSDGDILHLGNTYYSFGYGGSTVLPENVSTGASTLQAGALGGDVSAAGADMTLLNNFAAGSFVDTSVTAGSAVSAESLPEAQPMLVARQ